MLISTFCSSAHHHHLTRTTAVHGWMLDRRELHGLSGAPNPVRVTQRSLLKAGLALSGTVCSPLRFLSHTHTHRQPAFRAHTSRHSRSGGLSTNQRVEDRSAQASHRAAQWEAQAHTRPRIYWILSELSDTYKENCQIPFVSTICA